MRYYADSRGIEEADMAENESLDIESRQSRRWQHLRDAIRSGEADNEIERILLLNLFGAYKKVVRQIRLRPLLDALLTDGDVRGVLRECENQEYAQLIANQSQPGMDASDIMAQALWATADRFLEQIGMDVVGSEHWPDWLGFDQACQSWRQGVFNGLLGLASKLAESPDQPPRLPARTPEEKKRDLEHLNSMSLLRRQGGNLGQEQ
jgi:hypothetical protein